MLDLGRSNSGFLKFVPWISIRFNKIFLVRGELGANPLRVDVAFFQCVPGVTLTNKMLALG